MPLTIRKCLGCGAPLKGLQCKYCDTIHTETEPPDQNGTVVIHQPNYYKYPDIFWSWCYGVKKAGKTREKIRD